MIGLVLALASAAPVALQHQVRLVDAVGAPVSGTPAVAVELWSDDASADPLDRLWRGEFSPTVADGYAALVLDVGLGGATIDSAWFQDDVWVQVIVDGAPLLPRTRVLDVPRAAAGGGPQELARYDLAGPLWATTPGVTLRAGSYAVRPTTSDIRFSGWSGVYLPDLVSFALATPGQLAAGARVVVEVDASYVCETSDCDVGFKLQDGTGAWCAMLPGDTSQMWVYFNGWTAETNIGHSSRAANRAVRHTLYAFGPSDRALLEISSGFGAERNAWSCPRNLDPTAGLTLHLTGGHDTEAYVFTSVNVAARVIGG